MAEEGTQLFGVTTWVTLAAALLVSGAAFAVMRLYVRRVFRESQRLASQSLARADASADEDPEFAPPAHPLQIDIEQVERRPGVRAPQSAAFRYADRAFPRAAWIYVLGGSVHAAASVWLLFQLGIYALPVSSSPLAAAVWRVAVFWSWSMFTVIALSLFWGPDQQRRAAVWLAYPAVLPALGLLLEMAGTPPVPVADAGLLTGDDTLRAIAEIVAGNPRAARAITMSPLLQPTLFWALTAAPVTIPLITFNRFVRGTVGPLFVKLALTITLSYFVIMDLLVETPPGGIIVRYLNQVVGRSTFRVVMVTNLLLATAIACAGVLWIARRYRRGLLSDQTFLFDALWLTLSLWVCVYLMGYDAPFAYLLGLLPFGVYKLIAGGALWRMRRGAPADSDARLLFLRVFGSPRRTERLFDLLAARWRYAGRIRLISGMDAARAQFEPDEFLDFLGGRLETRYINSAQDLDARLAGLGARRDPDGRYRIDEFFCRADTWQPTVTRLMQQSDLLVMDLRGFTSTSRGCVFELGAIIDTVPLSRVVLLIDATTDQPLLRGTLAQLWAGMEPASPNATSATTVRVLDVAGNYPAAVRRLMQIGDAIMSDPGITIAI